MSQYQSFNKYKDSKAGWLSKIPEHWIVRRNKTLFIQRNEKNFPDLPLAAITQNHGVLFKDEYEKILGRKAQAANEDLTNYRRICPKDIVYNKMRMWQGAVGVSSIEAIVSPAYVVAKPVNGISERYFYWLFKSAIFVEEAGRFSYGLCDDMNSLRWEDFSNILSTVPPLEEQQTIASFLDQEAVRIDALIEKKQHLIELLQEKRQAIITQAVTKGLDPNVPMKDSCVEWLGKVPEHWDVSKLKRLATLSGGYAFESADYCEEGIQLIRIGNVYLNELYLGRQPIFVPREFIHSHSNFVLDQGDLIISLTGTLGKKDYGYAVMIDKKGPFLLNQRVGKFVIDNNKVCAGYLLRLLHSDPYLAQLYSLPFGTKQANLSNDDVLDVIVAYPPDIPEQEIIFTFISSEVEQYEKIINKLMHAIKLLQERRSALITAAVTGQIDVRGKEA